MTPPWDTVSADVCMCSMGGDSVPADVCMCSMGRDIVPADVRMCGGSGECGKERVFVTGWLLVHSLTRAVELGLLAAHNQIGVRVATDVSPVIQGMQQSQQAPEPASQVCFCPSRRTMRQKKIEKATIAIDARGAETNPGQRIRRQSVSVHHACRGDGRSLGLQRRWCGFGHAWEVRRELGRPGTHPTLVAS